MKIKDIELYLIASDPIPAHAVNPFCLSSNSSMAFEMGKYLTANNLKAAADFSPSRGYSWRNNGIIYIFGDNDKVIGIKH